METTSLTPAELKEQCPEGYAELERLRREFPDLTPIEECTYWRDAEGEFWMQDPADDGLFNVALVWDGEMWG